MNKMQNTRFKSSESITYFPANKITFLSNIVNPIFSVFCATPLSYCLTVSGVVRGVGGSGRKKHIYFLTKVLVIGFQTVHIY